MGMFKGVMPALLTPFTEDGRLYEPGIENQLNYLAENDIKSLFVSGSFGSFPMLYPDERKQLIELTLRTAKALDMQSIVHIGAPATEMSIDFAKFAQDKGADAIASVMPFYYSGTMLDEDDFLNYFEAIIGAVDIPVHCYNNPGTTGFPVSPEFLRRLIGIGLRGVKDGGRDVDHMNAMLAVANEAGADFDYILGNSGLLHAGILSGAEACVSGSVLATPSLINNLYAACIEKKVDKARTLQSLTVKVREILARNDFRVLACYDVMHARGVDVGTCKAPWRRNTPAERDEILGQLRELDLL